MVVTHEELKKLIGNAKVVRIPNDPAAREELFAEMLRNRPDVVAEIESNLGKGLKKH